MCQSERNKLNRFKRCVLYYVKVAPLFVRMKAINLLLLDIIKLFFPIFNDKPVRMASVCALRVFVNPGTIKIDKWRYGVKSSPF